MQAKMEVDRRERTSLMAWLAAMAGVMLLAGCGAQDLYEPPESPVQIVGHLPLPSQVEDVAVLGDYAYLAGGQAGLVIVDIADPANPVLVEIIDTVKYAESVKAASTSSTGGVVDIAFVVEGSEGITTYDITDPDNAFSFEQGTTAVDGIGLFVRVAGRNRVAPVISGAEVGFRCALTEPGA